MLHQVVIIVALHFQLVIIIYLFRWQSYPTSHWFFVLMGHWISQRVVQRIADSLVGAMSDVSFCNEFLVWGIAGMVLARCWIIGNSVCVFAILLNKKTITLYEERPVSSLLFLLSFFLSGFIPPYSSPISLYIFLLALFSLSWMRFCTSS